MGCLKLDDSNFERILFVSASNFSNDQKSSLSNYEMYFRDYDPSIGRMMGIDPYAELYRGHNPYHYALNNPIMMNDPSGGIPMIRDPDELQALADAWESYMNGANGGNLGSTSSAAAAFGVPDFWHFASTNSSGVHRDSDGNLVINWDKTGTNGGHWSAETGYSDLSEGQAHLAGMFYNETHNGWSETVYGGANSDGSRKLALMNHNGDFIQIGSDGKMYVPYTDMTYASYLSLKNDGLSLSGNLQTLQAGLVPDLSGLGNGLNETVSSSSSNFGFLNAIAGVSSIVGGAASIAANNSKPLYTSAAAWANTTNAAKSLSTKAGIVGLAFTGTDMLINGVNTSNSLDATFGVIGFFGPIGAGISGAYFVGNLITVGITGQSIGEHINNYYWIPSPTGIGMIPIGKKVK